MTGFDELWRGGPRFKQEKDSFRLSTDSVLLADFVNIKLNSRCLDLGSGGGVLCVLLAVKAENAQITGIEIQPEFARLSRENLCENKFDDRVKIITADLREHRALLPAEGFDLVVSNPPYFAQSSGYSAPGESRRTAREEAECTLEDICAAAKYSLRWGGSLFLVHRPERLSEIFCAMTNSGIEPKRLRMVCHKANRAPNLVLIEGRRGGSPGLTIEPMLVLENEDGSDSLEVRRIYRRGVYSPKAGEKK